MKQKKEKISDKIRSLNTEIDSLTDRFRDLATQLSEGAKETDAYLSEVSKSLNQNLKES